MAAAAVRMNQLVNLHFFGRNSRRAGRSRWFGRGSFLAVFGRIILRKLETFEEFAPAEIYGFRVLLIGFVQLIDVGSVRIGDI